IPKRKPTEANNFGSFAAEDGAGTEGSMGKGPQRTGANASGNENYGLDSCEAHNVGFSPQEDRNRSKSAVGED
ncbi:MAG: hypothetical protein ABSF15_29370, partial [Candidatus Sulfotelmatobacter sp.]